MFDKNFVRDFVGTKTDYEFDCENFRYRPKHLERQIPCQEHDSIARRDYIGAVVVFASLLFIDVR